MACGARWGLKRIRCIYKHNKSYWLNGLWSPLGIETLDNRESVKLFRMAKWPVEPVGD